MTDIHLNILSQRYDFTLEICRTIALSGVTALFGSSGAGKSTLLRIIAGFERGTGRVAFGGELWEDGRRFVSPHRRRVATVFRQPRLFAHLDVRDNLAYAARRAGAPQSVEAMIDRFGLKALAARRTPTLSGGEAQRVALARAPDRAAAHPDGRAAVRPRSGPQAGNSPYIGRLRDDAQVPILYVTHSAAEVARLSGQMLTLAAGRITGLSPISEMLAAAGAGVTEGVSREA